MNEMGFRCAHRIAATPIAKGSISRIREAEVTFDSPSAKAMAEELKKFDAVHYGS